MSEKADLLNKLEKNFIPTDVVDTIDTVIKSCSAEPAGVSIPPQFWLILGPSGVGKTYAIEHSCRRMDTGRTENSPVLYLSVSATFTPKAICKTILHKLGVNNPNRLNVDYAVSLVHQQLKARDVRAIIVDDIQSILYSGRNSAVASMAFLIDLVNQNNISFIGCGTPCAMRLLELNVPMMRRFSVINIAPFKYDE